MPRLRSLLIVLALVLWPTAVLRAADPSDAGSGRDARPALFICGDSTAAVLRPPTRGWGEEFGAFLESTKLDVENHARAGRSARTYIGEGHWATVRGLLRKDDIVLLQFGLNDSKDSLSIARYDLSGIGEERSVEHHLFTGEDVEIRTFGHYLRQMIHEAREAGAKVVVLSCVPRNSWLGGKVVRGEAEHVRWASEVAQAENVPYIDINERVAAIYDPLGRARTAALFFPEDNTHTNPAGARVNAAAVVTALAALDLPGFKPALKSDALSTAAAIIADVPRAAASARLAVPTKTAFPAPGARDVCPDTPLRLTFGARLQLGRTGKIHIIDTQSGREADTIDISAPVATKTIGGEPNYRYYPVIVSGPQVTIYPRNGALAYNRSYRVTIDEGVFYDAPSPEPSAAADETRSPKADEMAQSRKVSAKADAYAALTPADGWTFTTRPAPPAAGSTRLTVASDGTGDFCTVQGAIDFIPDGNTTPTTVRIKQGTYTEIIFFTNKHAITLLGEDRHQTVIAYATNDRFNPTRGNPFGTARPDPSSAPRGGHIYHRGVFLAHRVNDLVLSNLTIRNTTPQGGSQAEAIILNGTASAHAILQDVDLYSYQDTLQVNGQAYLSNCYIEGDVDFMWGTGPCFFTHCTARALRSSAYYTQIRNPGTNHGYVYVDCTFDGIRGVMGNYLSRVGTGRFPHSEVVLIDCVLGKAVGPAGWQFMGGPEGSETDAANTHFWEFNSHDPSGKPVDASFRLPGSRQLTEPKDGAVIAQYRDPSYVLGGWNPLSAPLFASTASAAQTDAPSGVHITLQPAETLALLGTRATLEVSAQATSGGRVLYRWFKNGQPIPGASSNVLRLDRVEWADAGVYTAVASNDAGKTTSAPARLTVVAPQAAVAPQLPRGAGPTFDVTTFGAVGDGATDNTSALQNAITSAIKAGGGTVRIPPAPKPYLSGPLTLGSNLTVEVAQGAILRLLPYAAQPAPGSYPLRRTSFPDFLSAKDAHDLALVGGGTIDGDGEPWWTAFRADKKMPGRPYLVRLGNCTRVLISGLTFTRGPMFHVRVGGEQVSVFDVKIETPESPNTDGVDPSGSHHLIQNCTISCGDDNIAVKAGGEFCSDLTIADCEFGEGHGLSVGGQSTRGLDGMVVKNCDFTGTTSGLRLKADPTQGGEAKNISYTNLVMRHVTYPIVFYSYYKNVGNPASIKGSNQTTVEKVRQWNAQPPQSLTSQTLPSWRGISVSNLTAADTTGYSIIWGLPLAGYLFDGVKLANVRIAGGPGFEIYDARNVQFEGDSNVGAITVANALAIRRQPRAQSTVRGGSVSFGVEAVGPATTGTDAISYAWTCNGQALEDGTREDGTQVAGAHAATLTLSHVDPHAAGKYAVTLSASLDGYDPAKQTLVPNAIPVTITSANAALSVKE
jgi:pectin methylesterase-like acyl-CoA thioesterase/lysophospholipase L1-like esterase